ncbi:unnamed protein product [Trichogramma brassicae]|uniref:Uncharacterized protein n=1 Tax=Trichogramma brassicae TaxID=86971 RepID=A0A6H5J6K2_9HYME|nr:unnamed protein product [Trichogramma brassicae]
MRGLRGVHAARELHAMQLTCSCIILAKPNKDERGGAGDGASIRYSTYCIVACAHHGCAAAAESVSSMKKKRRESSRRRKSRSIGRSCPITCAHMTCGAHGHGRTFTSWKTELKCAHKHQRHTSKNHCRAACASAFVLLAEGKFILVARTGQLSETFGKSYARLGRQRTGSSIYTDRQQQHSHTRRRASQPAQARGHARRITRLCAARLHTRAEFRTAARRLARYTHTHCDRGKFAFDTCSLPLQRTILCVYTPLCVHLLYAPLCEYTGKVRNIASSSSSSCQTLFQFRESQERRCSFTTLQATRRSIEAAARRVVVCRSQPGAIKINSNEIKKDRKLSEWQSIALQHCALELVYILDDKTEALANWSHCSGRAIKNELEQDDEIMCRLKPNAIPSCNMFIPVAKVWYTAEEEKPPSDCDESTETESEDEMIPKGKMSEKESGNSYNSKIINPISSDISEYEETDAEVDEIPIEEIPIIKAKSPKTSKASRSATPCMNDIQELTDQIRLSTSSALPETTDSPRSTSPDSNEIEKIHSDVKVASERKLL